MIEQASLTPSTSDGSLLVTLPRTGMDARAETRIRIADGRLLIGQGGRCFVAVPVEPADAELVLEAEAIELVEVDGDRLVFHEMVRRST
jgi:hypothetical protein